jgi:hypothetical protein
MRIKANLKSSTGRHMLEIDTTHVQMTHEQRDITTKLFEKVSGVEVDVDSPDPCEEGKCLASKYLEADEFSKVRGLSASLGTTTAPQAIIIDFCIHVLIIHPPPPPPK